MVYVVGALGSALSQTSTELIAARFVLGIAVGTTSSVAPMYISELAPKKIRGGVTSFNQLMVVSGRHRARWLYAGFGVIALVYFIARVPETKDRSLEQTESDLQTA